MMLEKMVERKKAISEAIKKVSSKPSGEVSDTELFEKMGKNVRVVKNGD